MAGTGRTPALPTGGTATVHALLSHWVESQPAAPAVRDAVTGRTLGYQELWRAAGAVAGRLAELGVGRGDLVAVDLERSVDLVIALLGVTRAGAAYLPVDRKAPIDRTRQVLDAAGARVLLTEGGDAAGGRAVTGVRTLVAAEAAAPGGPEAPSVAIGGEDAVYVAYTSGSTGEPKGVVVPHRAVLSLVTEPDYCVLGPGDRMAQLANPAFDALTFELWSALAAGATLVVLPSVTELTVPAWSQLVRAERITTMFLTTSLFHMVAREQPDALRSVRDVLVGGEQLDIEAARSVLAAQPPARLLNVYGPTETTTFATWFPCTDESLAGLERVPIGRPLHQTDLLVLDADAAPVADGETGELFIGGVRVALGYLNRPELTAERFVPLGSEGRHYRTGDLARRLPDGSVELVGRTDRQVKLRGFRIELEEIERAAVRTGLVRTAFVEKVGEGHLARLVGFVLPATTGGEQTLVPELARMLGAELPSYMVPSSWHLLTAVPLGPTGKADRAALVAGLTAAGTPVPVPTDAPGPEPAASPLTGAEAAGDPVTAAVLAVIADLFPLHRPRPADDFLALGGNSILAVQVATRLGKVLDMEVDPGDVLLADSLGALADRLKEGR